MFDEEGQLEVQNIFIDGENIISIAIYQKNGKLLCNGNVVNQLRQGEWKYFDEDGNIAYIVNYERGIRNGEWHAFDRDGNILMNGIYRNGRIVGIDIEE